MTSFLILWLAAQVISAAMVWLFALGIGRPVGLKSFPQAAILVAVKGHDIEFDGFLVHLFEQDYPAFRVIFAVEAADDAAVPAIQAVRARHPNRVTLSVAGLADNEGQKTTNLRAAAAQLTPDDKIVVLADADVWPARDWLKRLIAPLVAREADVVSGFAWLIPQDRKLSTLLLTSMAASVATMPRWSFLNAAWGGSTAITQDTFRALGLPEAWRGSLSDDLQLTNLAQRHGCRIAAPRELLLRTVVETTGFDAVAAEARRWYMLVRCHMPSAYVATVGGISFAALGWLTALAGVIAGSDLAADVLVGGLLLGAVRTAGRAVLVERLWGAAGLRENRWFLLADPLVTPLAVCLNAAFAWSAMLMRRTTWAGITYEILGPTHVRIVQRASDPAGVPDKVTKR